MEAAINRVATTSIPQFNTLLTDEIRFTQTAAAQLKSLLDSEEDDEIKGVRIFVAGGGCSGMSYGMTFTDTQAQYDCVYQASNGLKVFIDAVAMGYLHGVEVDFVERPNGASFIFNNAFQATGGSGGCGSCGSSSASKSSGGGCS